MSRLPIPPAYDNLGLVSSTQEKVLDELAFYYARNGSFNYSPANKAVGEIVPNNLIDRALSSPLRLGGAPGGWAQNKAFAEAVLRYFKKRRNCLSTTLRLAS
jgi:hypothetical protein